MNDSPQICCLCQRPFREFGNNPNPLASLSERCCDACNMDVIAARNKVAGYINPTPQAPKTDGERNA